MARLATEGPGRLRFKPEVKQSGEHGDFCSTPDPISSAALQQYELLTNISLKSRSDIGACLWGTSQPLLLPHRDIFDWHLLMLPLPLHLTCCSCHRSHTTESPATQRFEARWCATRRRSCLRGRPAMTSPAPVQHTVTHTQWIDIWHLTPGLQGNGSDMLVYLLLNSGHFTVRLILPLQETQLSKHFHCHY